MLVIPAAAAIVALAASSVTSAAAGKHPARSSYSTNTAPPPAHISNFDGNIAQGIFHNLTPYKMTLVTYGCADCTGNFWTAKPPDTLDPGQQFIYRLDEMWEVHTTHAYDGFFTYKADTVSGPEYVTLMLQGNRCTIFCFANSGPPLAVNVFDGSTAPTRDVNNHWNFGPATANEEIGWAPLDGPQDVFDWYGGAHEYVHFDYVFEVAGTFKFDASTYDANQSGQLANGLNQLCASGAAGAKCSFTPYDNSLSFSAGDPTPGQVSFNCEAAGGEPASAEVGVSQSRTTTLSVGGKVGVGIEADVFGVIEAGVETTFGVEQEWTQDATFEKGVKVFIPGGWIGELWSAPEIGTVTGTMTITTSKASYTITNLKSIKPGVQPDPATPPFNVFFKARRMTRDEIAKYCPRKARARPPIRSAPPPTGGLG